MASEQHLYSLYKNPDCSDYYLFRTLRLGFSNASQEQENKVIEEEQNQRRAILEFLKINYDSSVVN